MAYSYDIKFDFTTVHPGSLFKGKSGECNVDSRQEISEIDFENPELKSICLQVVHDHKPKWKVFMLNIKSIKRVK